MKEPHLLTSDAVEFRDLTNRQDQSLRGRAHLDARYRCDGPGPHRRAGSVPHAVKTATWNAWAGSRSCHVSVISDHTTTEHDETHSFKGRDILQRIPFHGDQIRELAFLHGPQAIVPTHDFRAESGT